MSNLQFRNSEPNASFKFDCFLKQPRCCTGISLIAFLQVSTNKFVKVTDATTHVVFDREETLKGFRNALAQPCSSENRWPLIAVSGCAGTGKSLALDLAGDFRVLYPDGEETWPIPLKGTRVQTIAVTFNGRMNIKFTADCDIMTEFALRILWRFVGASVQVLSLLIILFALAISLAKRTSTL